MSSPAEWAVLASPLRFDVVEAMRDLAPCGVRAIAARLRVRPDVLYRHIEVLQKAGFVSAAGFRKVARATEQLFDLTADDFQIDFGPGADRGAANDMIRDTADVFLKRMLRTIRATADARGFDASASLRNVVLVSDYAHLTASEFKRLQALLREAKALVDGTRGTGAGPRATQFYSVLLAAVPVVRGAAGAVDDGDAEPPRAEAPTAEPSKPRR